MPIVIASPAFPSPTAPLFIRGAPEAGVLCDSLASLCRTGRERLFQGGHSAPGSGILGQAENDPDAGSSISAWLHRINREPGTRKDGLAFHK
jgi:hypothetical protein